MRRVGMAVFLIMLGACSAAPRNEVKASVLVNKLYTALQHQRWNEAISLYGRKFYEGHSRSEWLAKLKSIQKELGPMQGRTLIFKRKDPRFHYDVYMFSWHVKYAHGESHDIITLFQDVNGGKLMIVGHTIKIHSDT